MVYHRCLRRLPQSLADRLDGNNSGEDWPVFSSAQPMQALDLARSAVGLETKNPCCCTLVGTQTVWIWAGCMSKGSIRRFLRQQIEVYLKTSCRAIVPKTTRCTGHNSSVLEVGVCSTSSYSSTGQQQSYSKNDRFHVDSCGKNACIVIGATVLSSARTA